MCPWWSSGYPGLLGISRPSSSGGPLWSHYYLLFCAERGRFPSPEGPDQVSVCVPSQVKEHGDGGGVAGSLPAGVPRPPGGGAEGRVAEEAAQHHEELAAALVRPALRPAVLLQRRGGNQTAGASGAAGGSGGTEAPPSLSGAQQLWDQTAPKLTSQCVYTDVSKRHLHTSLDTYKLHEKKKLGTATKLKRNLKIKTSSAEMLIQSNCSGSAVEEFIIFKNPYLFKCKNWKDIKMSKKCFLFDAHCFHICCTAVKLQLPG